MLLRQGLEVLQKVKEVLEPQESSPCNQEKETSAQACEAEEGQGSCSEEEIRCSDTSCSTRREEKKDQVSLHGSYTIVDRSGEAGKGAGQANASRQKECQGEASGA